MPTGYIESAWDADPRRAARCLELVRVAMLQAGWNKHSRKFDEVKMKKARKLFSQGGGK